MLAGTSDNQICLYCHHRVLQDWVVDRNLLGLYVCRFKTQVDAVHNVRYIDVVQMFDEEWCD